METDHADFFQHRLLTRQGGIAVDAAGGGKISRMGDRIQGPAGAVADPIRKRPVQGPVWEEQGQVEDLPGHEKDHAPYEE